MYDIEVSKSNHLIFIRKYKYIYIYIFYIYIYIITACVAQLAKASDTQVLGRGFNTRIPYRIPVGPL